MPKVIQLKENLKTTFIEHFQDGRHFCVFFFLVESFLKSVELLCFFLFYRRITSEQYNDLLMHDIAVGSKPVSLHLANTVLSGPQGLSQSL